MLTQRGVPDGHLYISLTISLFFSLGKFAELNSVTYGRMEVDESGKTKFTPDKWAAKLVPKSIKGNDATIEINIPADTTIGEWSLSVETITVQDKKKKHYRYEHPDYMYILFNPWCKGNLRLDTHFWFTPSASRRAYNAYSTLNQC